VKTAQHLLATIAAVIVCFLSSTSHAQQRAEGQRLATEWQAAFEKRRANN
jgi:hypothetical protein